MDIIKSHEVEHVINSYPVTIRKYILFLRELIFETASELTTINRIEESLKWGEPSYLTKNGSTIRIAWKSKTPNQYAMYFHCKTKLVDTFKQLYSDLFVFEGNRAIIFKPGEKIPEEELKYCIELSLTYQQRKRLPLLGA